MKNSRKWVVESALSKVARDVLGEDKDFCPFRIKEVALLHAYADLLAADDGK